MSIFISLFILTSYTVAVVWRWGVPKSLSRTFFSIKNKWIFSAVISTSFGLIMSPLMDILPEMWQWLGFLTVVGGLFVAFAPNLEDDLEEQVHMTGAIILGLSSQFSVAVIFPQVLGLWILFLVFLPLKERIFFAEMIGGVILFSAMLITIFNN